MINVVATIEMQFSGTVWTDVSADVRRSTAWSWVQGLAGSTPSDRVAQSGRLSFVLDNAATNSAGSVGYYSPGHSSCRTGFQVGLPTRIKLVSGTLTDYPFYGRVRSIEPQFGSNLERGVLVTIGDYMEQLATKKISLLPVQLSKRNDQLAGTIVSAMPIQPLSTDYDVGPDTFVSALNSEQDEKATGMSVLQKCMRSGLDYLYVRGNSTNGETLVYESRQSRYTSVLSAGTISGEMVAMDVRCSADDIWNLINTVVYPDDYDEDVAVLFSAADEKAINPTQSVTFTARYRDPQGLSQRASLYPGSEVTPVADTDFRFSSVSDSNGNDMNADLGVSIIWGGNSAEVTLTNNGTKTGYLQPGFQLRGRGIYHYSPVTITKEDATSISAYGEKGLSYDMPYQSDVNVANDFGNVLLARWKDPVTRVSKVKFYANRSSELMRMALSCRIGTRITIVESVTGVSAAYYINGVQGEVRANNVLSITWIVEKASAENYCVLDDAVYGLLDSTAYLGF